MAKKRYSYVGVTVLLSLLIPTPVLSDAPPEIIDRQRSLQGETYSTDGTDSTERIGGQPQVSSQEKPAQGQRLEGSSRKSSIQYGGVQGGTKPGGNTSVEEQREYPGTNTPSLRVETNDPGQGGSSRVLTNDPGQGGSSRVETNDPGQGGSSRVETNDPGQDLTNKNFGGSYGTGEKGTPSRGTGTEDNQIGSSNLNPDSRKNIVGLVNSDGDSNILDSFSRNPFLFLLLWWLPAALLGLLLWLWMRRRSSSAKRELEERIQLELWKRLDQHVNQYVDQIFEQKIQNYMQLITANIVNNNEEVNQYFDRRLQQNVTRNPTISNQIITFVANSNEINNKINKVYRDIDITVEGIRNEWNQRFIVLLRQYVDELIDMIGRKETFNILIASLISGKIDELLNEITRAKNELTVIMNNGDRHLYEWTLGELIAIKGCLTDRQALVEQLASFSAELTTKLECTPCVDIHALKPFKPIYVNSTQLSQMRSQQLPGS
ncbi:hypothetical protein NUACC21_15350 [Scytonema sp. NUACC21]